MQSSIDQLHTEIRVRAPEPMRSGYLGVGLALVSRVENASNHSHTNTSP